VPWVASLALSNRLAGATIETRLDGLDPDDSEGLCLLQNAASKIKSPVRPTKSMHASEWEQAYQAEASMVLGIDAVGPATKSNHESGQANRTEASMYGSDAYIMVSSALIFAMSIPGLPLLYGGLVQSKHTISTMTQCMAVGPAVGIVWLAVGFSLSFSGKGPWIGNLDMAFLMPEIHDRNRVYQHVYGPLPESVYFVFEAAFAVITAMLIVGAWAERAKFGPAVTFCTLWSLLVYCPLAHWIWGGGWLQQMGFRDFAGGCVVHLSAGAAALVAALLLPSRPGFPHEVAPPHSMPMVVTGLGIIWMGWFGFNGASALQAGGAAGMATVTTQTSAMVALLVWVALESMRSKPTLESAISGAIAGLGSITPCSGFVGAPGAIIVGVVGAVTTYIAWYICKEKGYADDALDVFPIHGVGGFFGTILVAFLSAESLGGVGYSPGVPFLSLLKVQCLGVTATFVWSAFVSVVLIKILDLTVGFCHPASIQLAGLDMADHNAEAYVMEDPSVGAVMKRQALHGSMMK
jgi:Amt family ammonium transporter